MVDISTGAPPRNKDGTRDNFSPEDKIEKKKLGIKSPYQIRNPHLPIARKLVVVVSVAWTPLISS